MIAAHRVLAEAGGIDFLGNVEGRDLPAAVADVVVTDGFTGNVALKLMEGTARAVTAAIRDAARANPISVAGALMLRPALGGLRRELHPDATGGAILLGLRGIAVVGHGSSGAAGNCQRAAPGGTLLRGRRGGPHGGALERGGGDARIARLTSRDRKVG